MKKSKLAKLAFFLLPFAVGAYFFTSKTHFKCSLEIGPHSLYKDTLELASNAWVVNECKDVFYVHVPILFKGKEEYRTKCGLELTAEQDGRVIFSQNIEGIKKLEDFGRPVYNPVDPNLFVFKIPLQKTLVQDSSISFDILVRNQCEMPVFKKYPSTKIGSIDLLSLPKGAKGYDYVLGIYGFHSPSMDSICWDVDEYRLYSERSAPIEITFDTRYEVRNINSTHQETKVSFFRNETDKIPIIQRLDTVQGLPSSRVYAISGGGYSFTFKPYNMKSGCYLVPLIWVSNNTFYEKYFSINCSGADSLIKIVKSETPFSYSVYRQGCLVEKQ